MRCACVLVAVLAMGSEAQAQRLDRETIPKQQLVHQYACQAPVHPVQAPVQPQVQAKDQEAWLAYYVALARERAYMQNAMQRRNVMRQEMGTQLWEHQFKELNLRHQFEDLNLRDESLFNRW